MGTTMTAVVAAGGRTVLIGHVGDSRAYLLHDGTLPRLTDDHSLVEELVREGRLTPEQAESHPAAQHRHARARQSTHDVEVDLYTLEVVTRRPDRVVLRRAHDDGARPRHRTHRARRTRPATRGRAARRRRQRGRRRRQHHGDRARRLRSRRRRRHPIPTRSQPRRPSATPTSIPAPDVAPAPPPPEPRAVAAPPRPRRAVA